MSENEEQLVDETPMKKMSVAPPEPKKNGKDKEKGEERADPRREEEELKEGLEESFPASDPPANVQPGHDRKPDRKS